MNLSILDQYGIDSQNGLGRCLGDEKFYVMLLKMFLNDDAFARARAAFEADDRKALFDCAHELKGSSGNVGLKDLYEAICPLVELLRGGSGTREEIEAYMARADAAYIKACEGISLVAAEG